MSRAPTAILLPLAATVPVRKVPAAVMVLSPAVLSVVKLSCSSTEE